MRILALLLVGLFSISTFAKNDTTRDQEWEDFKSMTTITPSGGQRANHLNRGIGNQCAWSGQCKPGLICKGADSNGLFPGTPGVCSLPQPGTGSTGGANKPRCPGGSYEVCLAQNCSRNLGQATSPACAENCSRLCQ